MKVGIYQDHHNEMLSHWCVHNLVDAINMTETNSAFAFSNSKHPEIPSADVIIFYRVGYHVKSFMIQLKREGKKVGYFLDDYLWSPQAGHGMSLIPIADVVDFFMFPNKELEQRCKEVCSTPTITIRPGLDRKTFNIMSQHSEIRFDKFNILISKGHISDGFKDQTMLILKELNSLGYKIHLTYFSNTDLPIRPSDNVSISRMNQVRFKDFYPKLASVPIDLILNPSPVDDFHHCKSPLKFLESASLKVPLLTSRLAAYKKMTDFKDILFGESPDEYLSKIMWLLHYPSRAKVLAENSRELLLKEFMIENTIVDFIDDLGVLLFSPKTIFISEKMTTKEEKIKLERIRKERENSLSPVHFNSAEAPKKETIEVTDQKRRDTKEKMPTLSDKSEGVCMPITYKSYLEFEFQFTGPKISAIEIFGATYNSQLKNPARFDIFCGNKLISSRLMDLSRMLDNHWWPLDFPEFNLDNSLIKFRVYNMDRRPISFYLAKNNSLGQKCSVNGTHTEPIAIRVF